MDLNLAFILIAFIPLGIGFYWYAPSSVISKWASAKFKAPSHLGVRQILLYYLFSLAFVYGYMNLIIHQLGFYELFFTDIMKGSAEAKHITQEFLAKYGDKHRHFGHGVFHGVINAVIIALPFIGVQAIVEGKSIRVVMHHFSYWLVASALVGGCISQFV